MKQTTVYNLIIVDASGSMESIYNQALAGINQTLDTIRQARQGNPGVQQNVTLLSFADSADALQYVYRNEPVESTGRVNPDQYKLRGCTALYDAIGDAATALRRQVDADSKALVTIITDGYENDSRRWNGVQVSQLVSELRASGWAFTYIGANQDVEAEAMKMGVQNSFRFESTDEGTREMFERENACRLRWNERVSRGEENLDEDYFDDECLDEVPARRVTPGKISRLKPYEVFVFGSNIAGRHNGGAARTARHHFGAMYGVGEGPQGQSYAPYPPWAVATATPRWLCSASSSSPRPIPPCASSSHP